MSTKIDVDININNKNAVKGAKETKKEVDKTKEAIDGLNSKLDQFSGGAVSAFKGMVDGAKAGVRALTTVKGAIIATGIGALVVAVGSLAAYFTSTEEGAEKLRVVTAALGTVVGVVKDQFINFGEAIFNAINNPRKALDDFGNAVKYYFTEFIPAAVMKVIDGFGLLGKAIKSALKGDFDEAIKSGKEGLASLLDGVTDLNPGTLIIKSLAKEIIEVGKESMIAAERATALERRMNSLKKVERELALDRAKSNAALQEQKLIAEDTTKSLEERIAAAQRASEIETNLLEREIAAAKERVEIIKAQNNLTASSEADIQKLYDAEIQLANLRAQSLPKQIELQNKINSLNQQDLANKKALADAETQDQILALENSLIRESEFGAKRAEIIAELLQAQMDLELENTELTEAQKESIRLKYLKRLETLTKEEADKEVEIEKDKSGAITSLTASTLGIISALSNGSIQSQRRLAAASAVANSFEAYTSTLAIQSKNPDALLFPGAPFVKAGVTLATGLLQARKIGAGSVPSAGSVSPPSAASGGGSSELPQLNLDFLNNSPNQENSAFGQSLRAYIVQNDLRDQNELQTAIDNQTTF